MDVSRIFGGLRRLVDEYRIPGTQLAIFADGKLTAAEFGEEERGAGRALTLTSKFPVGSITKAFTATVAMVLVADGELDLDSPVVADVPELRGLPGHFQAGLTLRRLLSHTGGLPDDEVPAVTPRSYVLDCCHGLSEVQRPGAGFSYSSVGYVLVGYLIERVTGMTWWEAVDAVLLRPLGIPAAFVAGPRPAEPIVSGHSVNLVLDRTRAVEQTMTAAEAPAGGLAMSATDLVSFGRMHLGGGSSPTLPDPAGLAEMRAAVPEAEPFGLADGWGLGLALFRGEGGDWWGHDGNTEGTSSHLRIDPANATVVALTTNANTGFAMWRDLVADLREAGVDVGDYVATEDVRPSTALPIDCLGDYVNGDTNYSIIAGKDDTLRLVVDGEPFAELTLYDDLRFVMRELVTGVSVHVGRFLCEPGGGRVDRIQVGGRLAWRTDAHYPAWGPERSVSNGV
ncbi:serine hydrolase domain-containing protein [Actinocrispum wychmicini]|uniref:CubicO group peptidase (Beta-lactamase class C family) n=1 Tax=Actinocrispum wychmicini TaxID=1213861 RepID=A0A4R2J6T0_9PSEU|nr:serine hydrolase domain-containing protein [Actinocrispum wychmicini]TCO54194.1 CubicO group peptidase (beta-lactamase class C family) [Actinocrispum wychmicini]